MTTNPKPQAYLRLPFLEIDFFTLYSRDLRGFSIKKPSDPCGLELGLGDLTETRTKDDISPYPNDAEARLLRGDLCFRVKAFKEVLNETWLARKDHIIDELGIKVLVAPWETFIYASYTIPNLRGFHLQTLVAQYLTWWETQNQIFKHSFFIKTGQDQAIKITQRFKPPMKIERRLIRIRIPRLNGFLILGRFSSLFEPLETTKKLLPGIYWASERCF